MAELKPESNLREQLQVIQAQMSLFRLARPWWRSGSGWLAGLGWLNFFALFWVVLFDLLPEQVSGSFVGLTELVFFLLAMGASMLTYGKGEK